MKFEAVRVGMKVVPFKKSGGGWDDYSKEKYQKFLINHKRRPSVRFFNKNGYYLVNIIEDSRIVLGGDNKSGDFYKAEDFNLLTPSINKQYQLEFI